MGPAIGDILPLALGIAVSPIPVIAAILMLLSPKAKGTSLGFLAGWVIGVALATTVFTVVSSLIPAEDPDEAKPVVGVIKIILGAVLLLLAAKQWRSRPAHGETAALPKWMSAIDTMTPAKALVLGFLLSALNPKNLVMAISAGVVIGPAALTTGETVATVAIFVLLAVSTVLVPVLAYLAASDRMRAPLEALRVWLVQNNSTVMSILLLAIGVASIGKGIGSF
ncbi:GAP family protein [Conyzicola sp.]|uniref:GAP family protein n=1 Tax=Conyzicola sp. TaxID=1969404 RepID=UPI00398968F1